MDISFPSGDQGWVSGTHGTVHGLRKWSETHVSSPGGGGYLHNGTGHISAPRVSSTIVERVEFWLKPEAGGGNELRLTMNIDVRDGHRLVVIWGAAAGEPEGRFLFILNQDSGQEYDLAAKTTFEQTFLKLAVARNRQDVVANLRNRGRSLSACIVPVMLGIALFPRLLPWALLALAVVTLAAANANLDERRARTRAARAELAANLLRFAQCLVTRTPPTWSG